MTDALVISNIALWVVVLALVLAVFALTRQIGILYERVAPMGALVADHGPKPGEAAPAFELVDLGGRAVRLGGATAKSTLLFFLSPACPVCKKLLPILESIARDEARWLSIVLASDGERAEHEAFRRRARLESYPYLLSSELGMTYRVAKLPHAVLIDERGVIRAKGLVNSREQLESLFAAKELGVGSVQEYLDTAGPGRQVG
jgi:methylamine dehydrogenase accessory protein MauD